MKYLSLIILPLITLLFLGCSSKNITSMQVIKSKKELSLKQEIKTSRESTITTYIDNNDKIKFMCIEDELSASTCNYKKKVDETIFGVGYDGYKALYKAYETECGIGSHDGILTPISRLGWLNHTDDKYCKYRYNSYSSYETNNNPIGAFIITLGTSLVTSVGLYNKSFNYQAFRDSIYTSKVDTYKTKLLDMINNYNAKGGIDFVYIDVDDIESSLEDKYAQLLTSTALKAGIVFLDEDTNELLSIIIFNKYKNLSQLASISAQINDIKKDIQQSNQYILKHEYVKSYIPKEIQEITKPADIPLKKEEFETIEAFNQRTQDLKLKESIAYNKLEEEYLAAQTNRTNTIDNLNKNYKEYLQDVIQSKNTLLKNIDNKIGILSKLIFLENSSGYDADKFTYDAQTNKLFFSLI